MHLLSSKMDPTENVLYMRVMPKVLRIYNSTQSLGATLSQDMGLHYLPQSESIQNFENISIEQLSELNPLTGRINQSRMLQWRRIFKSKGNESWIKKRCLLGKVNIMQ